MRERPIDRANRVALAKTRVNLSLCYQATGPWDKATAFHDQAEENLARMAHDDPQDAESLRGLASLRINWCEGLIFNGKADAALTEIDKNLGPLEDMHRREPNLVEIRGLLGYSHGVRAKAIDAQHRPADALADWERLIALSDPEKQLELRGTLVNLLNDAKDYTRALAEAEAIVAELPQDATPELTLFFARAAAGGLAQLSKNDDRADRIADVTLRLLEAARARSGPGVWPGLAKSLDDEKVWTPLREQSRFKELSIH